VCPTRVGTCSMAARCAERRVSALSACSDHARCRPRSCSSCKADGVGGVLGVVL
jgi:hypothetical protein